jgi:hypothetical protein
MFLHRLALIEQNNILANYLDSTSNNDHLQYSYFDYYYRSSLLTEQKKSKI